MADQDPNPDRQDRNVEEPGDTNSADIVGRTGEQMPKQTHDGLEDDDRKRSARVNDEDQDPVRSSGRVSDPSTGSGSSRAESRDDW